MNDTSQVQRFEVQPTQFSDAVSLIHNEFAVRAFRYIFLSSKCFLKKHLQTLRNNYPKVQWTEVLKVGTCTY